MALRLRAHDDPLIVFFLSSLTSSTKKTNVRDGPPLTKLSGSAHRWMTENVYHQKYDTGFKGHGQK